MINSRLILLLIALLSITACRTTPSATPTGPRTIIVDETTMSEKEYGKFISWGCRDFIDEFSGQLIEVGYFTDPELSGLGYVLYDGGYTGESTNYGRRGINHRWDWGPSSVEFAFVVKADGTGLFYDFSSAEEGERIKANDVYKCSQ